MCIDTFRPSAYCFLYNLAFVCLLFSFVQNAYSRQVKNYYTRLVSSNNRPDIEDIANQANTKRERGETVGPPPTPSMSTKRRTDLMQPTMPRAIASATDVVDADSRSPISQARSAQYMPEPRYQPTTVFAASSQPASAHGSLTLAKPFSAQPTVSESTIAARHDERAMREMDGPRRPSLSRADAAPSVYHSRVDNPYEDRERGHGQGIGSRAWQFPVRQDVSTPQAPSSYKPELGGYRQEASQQFARPSSSSNALESQYDRYGKRLPEHRPIFAPSRPLDPFGSNSRAAEYGSSRTTSSQSAPYTDSTKPLLSSMLKDEARYGARSAQPTTQPLAHPPSALATTIIPSAVNAIKQEPRKQSNLLSLLNSDSDAPKGPRFLTSSHAPPARTATPPQSYQSFGSTLQRPLSQLDRRDEPRQPMYQPQSYTQGSYSQIPARHTPTLSSREPVPPTGPRAEWPLRNAYTPSQSQGPSAYEPPPPMYGQRQTFQPAQPQGPPRHTNQSPPLPYPPGPSGFDRAAADASRAQPRHMLGGTNPYSQGQSQNQGQGPPQRQSPSMQHVAQQQQQPRQDLASGPYSRRGSEIGGVPPHAHGHAHHSHAPFRDLHAGAAPPTQGQQGQGQGQQAAQQGPGGYGGHARQLSHERPHGSGEMGVGGAEAYGRRVDGERERERERERAQVQERERERERERENRNRWVFGGGAYGPR